MIATDLSKHDIPQRYCLTWRRLGGLETFRHSVIADSYSRAIERSRSVVGFALGGNVEFWELQDSRTWYKDDVGIVQATEWANRRFRVTGGLCAFVTLIFLLLFAFLKFGPALSPDRAVETSITPISTGGLKDAGDANDQGIPEVSAPESKFTGIVVTTQTFEISAPRKGHITMRNVERGDRVVAGEALAEYDLSLDAAGSPGGSPLSGSAPSGDPTLDSTVAWTITAPITGIVIDDVSDMAMDVNEGTSLFRLARERDLRIRVISRSANIERYRYCDVWRNGSFVSLAEVGPRQRPSAPGALPSLILLDQFATIMPGTAVEVRCTDQ